METLRLCKEEPIYMSLNGEGPFAGFPTAIIRLTGCNCRCIYCDTEYAQESEDYEEMPISMVAYKACEFKCQHTLITGGEPLMQGIAIEALLREIAKRDVHKIISIETNGSIKPDAFVRVHSRMIYDYKLPSSGMRSQMSEELFNNIFEDEFVKFVVKDRNDFDCMIDVIMKYKLKKPQIFVSPVYGEIELPVLAEWIKELNMPNVRMQVQLHKIIWGNRRGV